MKPFSTKHLTLVMIVMVLAAAVSADDLDYQLIYDVPQEKMMKQFGKMPGQKLLAEDLIALTDEVFTGDTLRLLAVLVEWDDRPGTYSKEIFEDFFFSRDTYPGGSVADYFHEVSYGQVAISGEVVDWISGGYYTPYFSFSSLFDQLDPIVDFSLFDGDGDKKVDAVCFVRSGTGEEDSQDPNDIWSYASSSTSGWGPYDGVKVNKYNTSPEMRPLRNPDNPTEFSGVDTLNRIRVFCHELTHNFGLADLYDYDDKLTISTYYTPNDNNDHPLYDWCLMGYYGYGYFSLGCDAPNHLCGWSKMQLEWIDPVVVEGDFEGTIAINNIETTNDNALFKIPIDEAEGEYFLLEYRNPNAPGRFDKVDSDFSCFFWPDLTYGCDTLDHGLLITHVHDSVVEEGSSRINNGTPDYPHYTVIVEDAGYDPARPHTFNPEGHVTDSAQWWYPYETRKGALFSDDVAGQSTFGPNTTPSSDGYNGPSGIYVEVLGMTDGVLYAYVNTNYQAPCCALRGDCDGNGELNSADVIYLVDYLWKGGSAPVCEEEADVNGSDQVSSADVLYLVDYFWRSGPAPVGCP